MDTNLTEEMTQKLADEFSRIIRDALTPNQLEQVLSKNRSLARGICATHDFIDANLAMAEAFESVTKRKPHMASELDAVLWNTAWVRARNAQFPRKPQLVKNERGRSIFGFIIKDHSIYDPYRSECGRFGVDPADRYGLRPEEILALQRANSDLFASESVVARRNSGPVENARVRARSVTHLQQLYPNLHRFNTGGNLIALRHDCADGGYVLITDVDGCSVPEDNAEDVYAGRYAANGDTVQEAIKVPMGDIRTWIETTLACASTPTNIADYFAKTLGASPHDESLRELPLDTLCGIDCVTAIDAAAELLGQVNAAFGYNDTELSNSVTNIARRVVSVYWRG